jgi:plasmid stabilization system protein ParE
MKVIFVEEAKLEIDDTVLFYELEQPKLGLLFKRELKRLIDIIIDYPEIGSNENYSLKSLLLHKFPYKVIYSVNNDQILILAIAHQHRKPEYWADRN